MVAAFATAPFLQHCLGIRMVYLVDVLHQFYPWQAVVDRVLSLAPGIPPLWNPYAFCGSPLMADPQTQVLYPPAILFRLLPFPAAYGCYLAAHFSLAAAGMWTFLRGRGLRMAGAALGTFGYALGTHGFLLAANAPMTAAHAWLPWVAHFALRVTGGEELGTVAGLGVILGMEILTGCPPYVPIVGVLMGVLLVLSECPMQATGVLRVAGSCVLGLVLTAGLVSPMLAYVGFETSRGSPLPVSMRGLDDLPPAHLLSYVLPLWFRSGSPGAWWEGWSQWVSLHFVGSLVLILAVLGILRPGRKAGRGTAVVLTLSGVMLGLGTHLPVVGPLLKAVPPLSYCRHAAMWLVLTDFGLAWLGAIGLDGFGSGRAWARRIPARPARAVRTAVVVLSYAELVVVGTILQPTCDPRGLMAASPAETYLRARVGDGAETWGRVLRWPVAAEPGVRDDELVVGRNQEEMLRHLRGALQPNLLAVSGCRMVDGENPLVPNRLVDPLRFLGRMPPLAAPMVQGALRTLGVRYVVSRDSLPSMGRPVFHASSFIYKVPGSSPAAWVEPASAGQLEIVGRPVPGGWNFRVRLRTAATIVVSEAAIRGWRVRMDGHPAQIEVSRDVLIATCAGVGVHHVALRYDPVESRIGVFVSLVVMGVLGFRGAIMGMGGWRP